jgi:hypothetical protein
MDVVNGLTRRDPQTNPNFSGDAIQDVTINIQSPIPTDTSTEIPPSSPIPAESSIPAATPACTGSSGDWSSPAGGDTPSIIFTIKDCKITVVMIIGIINGEWVTVSNEASQPITGSEFNFPYSFNDQNRYNLSGTFTSSTSASIKLVFFKGFRFTTDGPGLQDDLFFNATATP